MKITLRAKFCAALRRHPCGWLLAAQLLAVCLYPFMEDSGPGRTAFVIFGNGVLALALWVVNRNPTVNWIGWLLAVPAAGLSIAAYLGGWEALLPASHVLESAVYFYAAAGLICYMLADYRVSLDEILAAGATFTLLAWGFAFAFSVCQQWSPGSFAAAQNSDAPRTWMELLFLSFSTLSSVGLSDIIPVKPGARALIMLEMFCGVMYIAIVVSRLVALATLRVKGGK
ncbi:MAG: ion channel [Verrucomicrobiota bacterium]